MVLDSPGSNSSLRMSGVMSRPSDHCTAVSRGIPTGPSVFMKISMTGPFSDSMIFMRLPLLITVNRTSTGSPPLTLSLLTHICKPILSWPPVPLAGPANQLQPTSTIAVARRTSRSDKTSLLGSCETRKTCYVRDLMTYPPITDPNLELGSGRKGGRSQRH